jgi:phospholipid-binding lipoprotein MlaA
MNTVRIARYRLLVGLLVMMLGCGCAARQTMELEPARHPVLEYDEDRHEHAVDVYDPLEPLNRRTYMFNYYFDTFVYLPLVALYEAMLPKYVEQRVSNAVDNILEFNNFTNNLLQLKMEATAVTVTRFLVNTTLGLGGLWDPATGMGMMRRPEDFGQTLGHYGVGNGPYIVLPLFGPSNLRDTSGLVADSLAFGTAGPFAVLGDDEAALIYNGVAAIDKRHRQPFRYYQTGSPFEYELIRMLYSAKREMEIAR